MACLRDQDPGLQSLQHLVDEGGGGIDSPDCRARCGELGGEGAEGVGVARGAAEGQIEVRDMEVLHRRRRVVIAGELLGPVGDEAGSVDLHCRPAIHRRGQLGLQAVLDPWTFAQRPRGSEPGPEELRMGKRAHGVILSAPRRGSQPERHTRQSSQAAISVERRNSVQRTRADPSPVASSAERTWTR